jgi:hypothetical protein
LKFEKEKAEAEERAEALRKKALEEQAILLQ